MQLCTVRSRSPRRLYTAVPSTLSEAIRRRGLVDLGSTHRLIEHLSISSEEPRCKTNAGRPVSGFGLPARMVRIRLHSSLASERPEVPLMWMPSTWISDSNGPNGGKSCPLKPGRQSLFLKKRKSESPPFLLCRDSRDCAAPLHPAICWAQSRRSPGIDLWSRCTNVDRT